MGIRKAQDFTIRHSGLGLPTTFYGKHALYTNFFERSFALSLSEVLIRVAIEQIKCHVPKNTGQKYKDFLEKQKKWMKKCASKGKNLMRHVDFIVEKLLETFSR